MGPAVTCTDEEKHEDAEAMNFDFSSGQWWEGPYHRRKIMASSSSLTGDHRWFGELGSLEIDRMFAQEAGRRADHSPVVTFDCRP